MNLSKLNKRADTSQVTNNVLGVIVAVIGIGLLIFGIVRLYSVFSSQEEKNAKSTLNSLAQKIDALNVGDENSFLVQGFSGAENWYLGGWGKSEKPSTKPDSCYFDSCLCICYWDNSGKSFKEACDSVGFCKKVDYENIILNFRDFYVIKYSGEAKLLSSGFGIEDSGRQLSCPIRLNPNLLEIPIKLTSDGLFVQKILENYLEKVKAREKLDLPIESNEKYSYYCQGAEQDE